MADALFSNDRDDLMCLLGRSRDMATEISCMQVDDWCVLPNTPSLQNVGPLSAARDPHYDRHASFFNLTH